MVIERLEIENFRSLKNIDVGCDDLTILLGRNGAGKSSILYALDFFYNVSAQATPFDYFDQDTQEEIKIRVTFGDLRSDEIEEFRSQLTDGKLIVTKIINTGGSKYYGASRQVPAFHEIRQLPGRDKIREFNELVDGGRYAGIGDRVRAGQAAEEAMLAYEIANPTVLETFESVQQFLGPRNIGGGKLDKFTKFVLIPAVRNAASENEKKGAILQLIDVLVMRSVNKRPDVQKLNEEFEKKIKQVYSQENLQELGNLAAMITQLLAQYAPGAELDLAFGEIVPPKIPLPPAIASLVEDNFKCPIDYTGHGLQRALIFALLQQLSATDLSPEQEIVQESEGVDAENQNKQIFRAPDLILAIEEPELYQHPSRSRYLATFMDKLSRAPEQEDETRTQILLATHSPYFVNIENFDRVRLARKVPAEGHDPLQCQITEYSRVAAAERLAQIADRAPSEFTAESFAARATPVMTSMVNEGFFADVAVVVEGIGDAAIIWALQELLNKNWDARGIAVIPAGGKNNIDRPVVVFSGLGVPTYFVFDGDSRHAGKEKEADAIRSNGVLLRLAGTDLEGFPDTQVRATWAIFSDELETELMSVGDDVFFKIRGEVAEELGYDRPSTLLKNPHAASCFIKRMYALGHRIPVLEDIVENVTNLRI